VAMSSDEIKVCDKVRLTMDVEQLNSVCLPHMLAGVIGVVVDVSSDLSGGSDQLSCKVRILGIDSSIDPVAWLRPSMLTVIGSDVSSED
jgi:hypothetical protein